MKKMAAFLFSLGMILTVNPVNISCAAEESNNVSASQTADSVFSLKDITGKWKYQVASGNAPVEEGAKDNGIVEIKEDGTFTYTDAEGKTNSGTVKTDIEEGEGGSIPVVMFFLNDEAIFGGYYRMEINEISLGDGGMARLIRDEEKAPSTDIKEVAGKWFYQVSSGNYTIDKGAKDLAVVEIKEDSTYTYTDNDGKVTTGTVSLKNEDIAQTEFTNVEFYVNGALSFSGYYHKDSNIISIGNGGMARLIRDVVIPLDINEIAGKWKYQISSGNYPIENGAKDFGTVVINTDGTYSFTDSTGKVTTGTVGTGTEEIARSELPTVGFYSGTVFSFGGYYRSDTGTISIGNGGMARLIRDGSADGFLLGDVNNDKIIDARDASEVLTYYARSSTGKLEKDLTDTQKKAADYNKDEIIDGRDATEILTFYARSSVKNN